MDDPPLIITAQTLRNVLECERRVWLDAHGDPALRGEPPPETLRLYALGVHHEQTIHATAGPVTPVPVASWAEAVRATSDLMQRGSPGIIGACLAVEVPLDSSGRPYHLHGRIDRLVRLPGYTRPTYAAVEIKQRSRPEEADWLQLDFYTWLLGLVQGTTTRAELWLGADEFAQPYRRIPHDFDEDRLMNALARAAALVAQSLAPGIRLAPHCKGCPWLASCEAGARQAQSIDLLYGVSRTTRASMRQAGISTLAHVAACTPEELQQVRGIGPVTAPAIRANALAWIEGRPVRLADVSSACAQPGWMFDLETLDTVSGVVPWCMGWCDVSGSTQIAVVAPVRFPQSLTLPAGQSVTLVPDSDTAWEVLADAVQQGGPIFHWTGYDVAVLRGSAPTAVRAQLEPRFVDLHAAFKRTVSLPLRSTSIKAVSVYLGFPWTGTNDWFAAYLDYRTWLDHGDMDALTRACLYQRADVQSMAWVWRWLVQADRAIGPAPL